MCRSEPRKTCIRGVVRINFGRPSERKRVSRGAWKLGFFGTQDECTAGRKAERPENPTTKGR